MNQKPLVPQRVVIVVNIPKPPVGEGLARAFERLGSDTRVFMSHLVNTPFDRYIIHNVNHLARNLRLVPKGTDLFEGHPRSHKEYRNRKFLELCREFKPDLVFLTRGLRFKVETLAALREFTTVFCWYTESEKRFPEIEAELPYYHHTYFFSSQSLEKARNLGFTNTSLLLHALDTGLFHRLALPKLYDWCFVGQWHARRQQYLEGLATVSKNFVVYGPRWRKHTLTSPTLFFRLKGTEIWGEALTRLYNQTRVVINVSVWGSEGAGANLRLLEVPACGACLLTDVVKDASLLLEPEKEFVGAADLPEMQQKLAALLADEPCREEVARRGYEKAAHLRTYDHLVAQVCGDWARYREISG